MSASLTADLIFAAPNPDTKIELNRNEGDLE
jgi:hypothetical protein